MQLEATGLKELLVEQRARSDCLGVRGGCWELTVGMMQLEAAVGTDRGGSWN